MNKGVINGLKTAYSLKKTEREAIEPSTLDVGERAVRGGKNNSLSLGKQIKAFVCKWMNWKVNNGQKTANPLTKTEREATESSTLDGCDRAVREGNNNTA